MQPVKILHSSKHVLLFCLPQAGENGGLSGGRTVPTSHCPEARWQDNPGAAATPSRAAVMRGDRAAISDADGHTGGGNGDSAGPHYYGSRDCPVRSPRHSLRQQGADAYTRGTDGSNPVPSSGESHEILAAPFSLTCPLPEIRTRPRQQLLLARRDAAVWPDQHPIVDEDAGSSLGFSRPQITLPSPDPDEAQIVEADVAIVAMPDVPKQHRLADAAIRSLRKVHG